MIEQVMLCGFGGQGIILTGTILGQAAFNDGKWVSGINSYGAAARGGTCRAEVIISDSPISFPRVIEADILIAMHHTAFDKYIGKVKRRDAVVIYDPRTIFPKKIEGLKYVSIPATKAAIEELNNGMVANVIMLGAAVEITRVVSKAALKSAVVENVRERLRELNLRALEIGFELGRKSSQEIQIAGDKLLCR